MIPKCEEDEICGEYEKRSQFASKDVDEDGFDSLVREEYFEGFFHSVGCSPTVQTRICPELPDKPKREVIYPPTSKKLAGSPTSYC